MNAKDSGGRTALWYAASRGHVEIVKALLAHGADANVRDRRAGLTVLGIAAMEGETRPATWSVIVQLLKQAGAKE